VILYLDTSSLVKLYVEEAGSNVVRGLVERSDVIATAAIAYPETRAAFARLRREGAISPRAFASGKRALEDDWPRLLAVMADAGICRRAGDLAERHRLRGFDAVHLACYLEVARRAAPAGATFSSFDKRLTHAARAAVLAEKRRRV
jgi:uncharacterized protein